MLKRILIGVALLLIHVSGAWAATKSAVVTGNWNAAAGVWSTGACGTAANTTPPAAGDTAIICGGVTVTLTSSPTISQMTINATGVLQDDGAASRTLTVGGGGGTDITNNGAIDFQGANPSTIAFGNNLAWAGAGVWNLGAINIVNRTLTFAATIPPTLSFSAAAPIVRTTGTVSSTTAAPIFNFNGTVAQTLPAAGVTYGSMTINNAAGVTLGAALNVVNLIGPLSVQSGILNNGGFAITMAANQNFSVANGATFNMTGTSGMVAVSGTGTRTFGTTLPGCSTVNYAGAAQTVTAASYGHLTLSGSAAKTMPGTALTIACDFSMSGSASATSANTISVGRDFIQAGTSSFTAGAAVTVTRDMTLGTGTAFSAGTFTHNVGGNFSNNGTTFTASTGLFNFNGAAAQVIGGSSSTAFNSVTIANTSGGVSLGANETVGGTLTLTSGTLSVGANTLTLNGPAIAGAGANSNLSTTSSSSLSFGGSAASVFVPSNLANLNNLTINNASGVTENSSLTLAGTLTLTSGTFSVGANTLALNGPAIAGAGANSNLSTTSSSSLSFGGSSSGHFIPSSVAALNNLTVNNSNGVAENSSITLGGTLVLTSGALSVGANTLTLNGPAISQTSGSLTTTSSSNLTFGGSSSGHFIPSSVAALNNLIVNNSNGVAENSSITLSGTLTLTSGALAVGANTLTLNGPAISQTSGSLTTTSSSSLSIGGSSSGHFVPSSAANLNHLTVNNANGVVQNGNLTLAGNATITAGTLNTTASNRSLSVGGNITGAGTLKANGSAISVGGDMTVSTFTADTSTVTYNGGGAQAAGGAYTYNHLVINKSGGSATLGGNTIVGGNLTITAGTLDTSGSNRSLSVTGNITGAGGLTANGSAITVTGDMTVTTFTAGTSTVTYNGGGAQTVGGTYSFRNLTINKGGGTANLGGDASVSGTLTLTSGNIAAGANAVIISSTGSVSRTSGHIIGNLRKNVATGATTRDFEVGDASVYAPLSVAFASVTTAGDLTVKTLAAEHPDIANSGIDSTQDVTRYWVAANSGIVFTTYSATMTYVAGDVDGGVDLTTFGIGKADSCSGALTGCTWRFPTVVGAITNTTAQASGMTSFSSFGVGRRVDKFIVEPTGGGSFGNQDADNAFGIKITAVDKNGNTVNGFTGTADISSGCTLSGGGGTTTNFAGGIYTGNVTLSSTGSCTLTSTLTTNVDVTGNSNTFVSFRVSSFNVVESSEPASTGKIFTRIAGTNFSVDYANNPLVLHVAALDNTGTVITGFFPRSVTVEVVDNTTGGGVCASMTQIGSFPAENFVSGDAGRHPLTAGSSIANVYRNAKFRIKYIAVSPNITSCSIDNFAIRPASLTVAVTHDTRTTAGTSVALNNTLTSNANIHNAGRPFTIQATGKNSAAATTTNYDGSPAVSDAILGTCSSGDACPAPIGAAFVIGTWSAGGGTITTSTASYGEVGAFTFKLQDSSYASVDIGDGTSDAQRIVNYSAAAFDVGRFVPDRFLLSATSITPRSDIAACSASTFTYLNEPMEVKFTLTAASSTNTTTTRYDGTLARLNPTSALSYSFGAIDSTLPTPLTARLSTGTIAGSWSAGVASNITVPVTIARAASPDGPFASLKLGIAPSDPDTVTLDAAALNLDADNNATPERALVGTTAARFGRLRVLPATGVANLRLPVAIRAEYWNGAGFITNTADSCTTLRQGNITMGSYAAAPLNLNACETRVDNGTGGAPPADPGQTISFTNGTGSMFLTAPGATNNGSVLLTVNLGAASGNYCRTVGGTETGTTTASKSYLQGAWNGSATYDQDPRARAAFGVYGAQSNRLIFMRESY